MADLDHIFVEEGIVPIMSKKFCLLLVVFGAALLTSAAADDAVPDGPWEMSNLNLSLKARNATSAYHAPATKEVETLLLHTVDPDMPGIAFRCEKGRLFTMLAVRPSDLRKSLREGVRKPRDWTLTYKIGDAEEVTEEWVSMSNGRLYMAHETASTFAVFQAALDDETLTVTVKGKDSVSIDVPPGDGDLFDAFLDRCALDAEYDPRAQQ